MRKRWKGLLCLWLALLVLLSGQSALAAEPAYLYTAGQAGTLETNQCIQEADRALIGIEIGTALTEHDEIMNALGGRSFRL